MDTTATFYVYRTPHGPITIGTREGGISIVSFGDCLCEGKRTPTELSNRAANELLEYFAGKRREFDLPLAPEGTPFQQSVWNMLTCIPYGKSKTCSLVAKSMEHSTSHKAIGSAVRKNPIEILIPSHRIVSAARGPLGSTREAAVRFALLRMEEQVIGYPSP